MKRMRLRYAGVCTVCAKTIEKDEWGIYVKDDKTVHCVEHGVAGGESKSPAAKSPKGALGSASKVEDSIPKLIKTKYPSKCTACDRELAVGAEAFWVPNSKVMVCPPCTALEVAAGLGTAGGSAGRTADGAAKKQAERLLATFRMLGEHLIENAKPSAVMHRWDRGTDGERVVGRQLDRSVATGAIAVLHDRTIPARGGNIDHIVVGPRRITVIDAKHYRGHKIRVSKRNGERTLEINGDPAEELVDGVLAQRRHVELAVGSELGGCVEATLAFVGADLGWLGQSSSRGVYFMNPKDAVDRAAVGTVIGKWPYRFDAERRQEIAELLAQTFPPA